MVKGIQRWCGVLLAITALLWLPGAVWAEEQEVTLQLPPQTIAQWYKPQNKRQVWLHTMFGLRREMQAIQTYIALQDGERLEKWSGKFLQHYRSIPQMVPEWNDEVELAWADKLEQAVAQRQWQQAGDALGKLGMTCRSCHQDYRAVAAALYRGPRFEQLSVEDSETLEAVKFSDAMHNLTYSMNGFKIAVDDQRYDSAAQHLQTFAQRLHDLRGSCTECHATDLVPVERILGEGTDALLAELSDKLSGDRQGIGRKLGEVGVTVCSRCHGVHRGISDLAGSLQ